MKFSQLLVLFGSASAQLDMEAFMKALMAKDPKQVRAFKERVMRLPAGNMQRRVLNTQQRPNTQQRTNTQQRVQTTRRPTTTTQKPTTKATRGPSQFNYRNRPSNAQAPVLPNWLQKKDRKVIDLTKKPVKKPVDKKSPKKTPKKPTAATISGPRSIVPGSSTLSRKVNNDPHIKIASPLSAGGRFFGYKSIVDDIPQAQAVKSPFDIDGKGVKMAMKEKQVFGRGSYARSSSKTTQCFSCQGQSYSDCLSAGQTEQCMSDETSCFVREYTQEGGIVGVYMGCQNVFQCVSDFNANSPPQAQGKPLCNQTDFG